MKLILSLTLLIEILSVAYCYTPSDYENLILDISSRPEYVSDFENNVQKLLKQEPNYFDYTPFANENYTFDCPTQEFVSKAIPTSVHKLRPGDIKVVAALGDSLTAALGGNANTIFGLLLEYRGRSWSIGGQSQLEKVVTLPNIIKKFNPLVKGSSKLSSFYPTTKEGVGLNQAVSGAEASDIPTQAANLVKQMKESKEVDFDKDWKLITLFIGGNDLCRYDQNKELHGPTAYINDIINGIDILFNEVPRAFVNLVTVLDAGQVRELNKGLVCKVMHKLVCKEAAYPASPEYTKELKAVFDQYANFTNNINALNRWEKRDDFTVVVQPMFEEYKLPYLPDGEPDLSFFAPDCFHLSAKGHAECAVGLWNNMLEKVGQKAKAWTPGAKIACPTKENPYLFTNKNSN